MRIAHRKRANTRYHKRHFTRHAMKVHKRNIAGKPMRGGIRL